MAETNKRWRAIIIYRSELGGIEVEHFIEELEEIGGLVEAGPHWDTIINIEIALNRPAEEVKNLTLEEAERL
jgi:hypothetical protein